MTHKTICDDIKCIQCYAQPTEEHQAIMDMTKFILKLTQRCTVEKRSKTLFIDAEEDPATEDELLEALRSTVFGDFTDFDEFSDEVNEELKYSYWCCGRWRYPLELVDHVRERHT